MNIFGKKAPSKIKNRVGLDIGTNAVKIIEIAGPGDKPALAALGLKKVASSSKMELAALIKALVDEARVSTKEVNISLSGPSLVVRSILMPKMTDEELKGAIRFEAEKFIPFNINDCVVDFQVMGRDERENKLNILLAAAKKEQVLERIKLVEDAGLTVRLVDVDSFALANSFFKSLPALSQDKTFSILNIGASFTNLNILRGSSIYFTRDVTIGGNDFTKAIAKRLGIEEGAAEELKIAPKEKPQEVLESIKPVLVALIDDIKLSFSYYENQFGRNIDEVYVSGGGSTVGGLGDALQEALGSKPSFWNPLGFLDVSSGAVNAETLAKINSSFGIAAGLATRTG